MIQNERGQISLLSPVSGSQVKYWILKVHISNVCPYCRNGYQTENLIRSRLGIGFQENSMQTEIVLVIFIFYLKR